jgi:hypothetical protein
MLSHQARKTTVLGIGLLREELVSVKPEIVFRWVVIRVSINFEIKRKHTAYSIIQHTAHNNLKVAPAGRCFNHGASVLAMHSLE